MIISRALIILLVVNGFTLSVAQDDVVSISLDRFYNNHFYLDDIDSWVWKSGHDQSWALEEINTEKWIKLNPQNLSPEYSNDQGRIEGWFRLKVDLDTSLQDELLYFKKVSRDACEIFINGQLVLKYGEIHSEKKKTLAHSNSGLLPRRVHFKPGINTIAIHLVDYTAMYPARLRSRLAGSIPFLAIVNHHYYDYRKTYWQRNPMYKAIWFSVCTLLVLLFWFLVYRNPKKADLKWVATCSSLLLLTLVLFSFNDVKGLSIGEFRLSMSGFFFTLFCTLAFIPMMVSVIFTQRIADWIRITSAGIVIFGAFNVLVLYHILPMGICILTCFSICIYLVFRYRHHLQGAQSSIVIGILSTVIFLSLLFGILTMGGGDAPSIASKLDIITTGVYLSFPLSMLIYVAMRFQEMIKEVSDKASELIHSEKEKQALLSDQNIRLEKEVKTRTKELEASLFHLKSTQTQLIHAEKMASLGELTAGIAHEIQNPLNFVNNFSEVSNELLTEAEEELAGGNYDEVTDIVADLKENLSKINQHGGRASSIVQGMLAHSRTSTGEKELTDINALCDEYMRLAYHGMRAKDKNFNSDFELDLDPNLPKVKVVPQDIGRVLLNLLNNAFYAVHKKSQAINRSEGEILDRDRVERQDSKLQAPDYKYTPSVKVGTKFIAAGNSEKEMVRITVTDNGEGMSPQTVEKVFQPFFTTKPTGEGTGLGLSLSYDIVTKGHGGTLEVESPPAGRAGEVGVGTEFLIRLPIL